MNTTDYLLETAMDQRIAIIANGSQYTYGELKDASRKLTQALRSAGVKPTETVGLLGENSLFWVAAYLAILKIGAIAVPFPTVYKPEDLLRRVQFVNSRVICADKRSSRRVSGTFDARYLLIQDDVLNQAGTSGWEGPTESFDGHQDAALMLTSGTTAQPRAVRVTHRNIQANTDSIIQYLELTPDERILVVLPFYYCFGTSLLHTHLRAGASLVLCNTFVYPETALDLVNSTQCTGFAGVPSTYQTLLRNTSFPRRKFTSLHKVQQAGGKLPVVFIKELVASLPEAKIFIMYGQTEATARLSYLPPDLLETKMGSVGRGIPNVTLKVLNEAGDPVKPGEVGEITAWGDNISPGYLNEPEATAEKFAGGCLHTEDLATVDEDGFIYIVDRMSDFIKSLGRRVSSQEVEAHILELPEVVAAAAIGEPDSIQGEAIKVFITLRKGSTLTTEDVLAFCRQKMARYMVPKEIVVLDSLPTNAHGKVVKTMLREQSKTFTT